MGISIIDNFDYRAGKPNFTRDLFENIEEMVAFPEMYLPTVFECNIKSGDRYRYNANNEVDPILGKWRLVSSGTSGPVSGYTKDEINAKLDKKLDKPEIEGTEGQFLSLDVDGKTVFVDLPQYDDTEIRDLIDDIERGNLSYEIVTQLPDNTLQTVNKDTVYMVPTSGDVYKYSITFVLVEMILILLIGIPYMIIVGKRAAEGICEFKNRATLEKEEITFEEAINRIKNLEIE